MRRLLIPCAVLMLALPAARAEAQDSSEYPGVFLAGWYGVHFNNGVREAFEDTDSKPKTMGLSLGVLNRGLLSAEFDFGYSKDYFQGEQILGGNDLLTATASLIVGPWIKFSDNQAVRPYVVVGGGLARSKIEDFAQFGANARNRGVIDYGGGLFVYIIRNLGVRGDLRFLRDVGSDEDSDIGWGITETTHKRVTAGVFVAF